MNIFETYLKKIKSLIIDLKEEGLLEVPETLNGINVDIPPTDFNYDVSTNVAMFLSKVNKKSPTILAEIIINHFADENIEKITIAKPGFINIKFTMNFWNIFLKEIINNHKSYGSNKKDRNSYLVEFVSANPTGPLHVGHCRGAILGDVISNILIFNNHNVTKEYYVNDHGNQITHFTKSIFFRAREILKKEDFPINDPYLYPGDYLIGIANNIINENKDLKFDNFDYISKELTLLSVKESLKLIKLNLNNLGIKHDNFCSESEIVKNNEVLNSINILKKKDLIYKGKIEPPKSEGNKNLISRNQLLFKSTLFGDDKDRALQKADNSWTYFASDVAYHNNKIERKFDFLINVLGADHAGYIKRITSSVEALSGDKNKLICKVRQLVKLIKDNKPFKMSKRKGDYIPVEDLVN